MTSMRKGTVLTDDVRARIDVLAASSKNSTPGKIAHRLGLKVGTVHWYMLTRGYIVITPRYQLKPYVRNGIAINPYSPEHDKRLLELRTAGHPYREIAEVLTKEFGVRRTAHSVQVRNAFLSAIDDEVL